MTCVQTPAAQHPTCVATAAASAAAAVVPPVPKTAPVTIPYSPGPEQHVRAAQLPNAIEAAAAANTAVIETAGHEERTTRFSSRTVPAISLYNLAEHMRMQTQCSEPLTLPAAVLLIRYCTTTNTPPTSKTVHRIFIAALHVAIKTHSDRYFRNDAFALFAGITCKELNRLESIFVNGVNWRVLVHAPHVAAALADPSGFVAERLPQLCLMKKAEATHGVESAADASGRSSASHSSDYLPATAQEACC